MKMTGLEAILTAHCDESKLSEEYKTILDVQVLAAIQKELGLGKLAKPTNKKGQKGKPVKKKVNKTPAKSKGKGKAKKEEEIFGQDVIDMEDLIELSHIMNEEKNILFQEESWKKMFKRDRRMFGQDSQLDLTDEEKGIVDLLLQVPSDYVPFSDTSDRMEDVSDFEDQEEEEQIEYVQTQSTEDNEVEKPPQAIEEEPPRGENTINVSSTYHDEYLPEIIPPEIKKLYSGMLTLTITLKKNGEASELKEVFTLYTSQELTRKYKIPKDMNFQEILNYSDVLPIIEESLEERDVGTFYEKSFVTGWIESGKAGSDSLFVKLAENMRKNNVVRCFRIDAKSIIYFLHPTQIHASINDNAPMLFVIATFNN